MKKVIIIGGNPAGLSAASAIRKAHADWDIIVYEKDQYISYGSCGIPYYVEDSVKSLDKLITLTPEILQNKRNIPLSLYHEVIEVDFKSKIVKVKDIQNDKEFQKEYDFLLISTGGSAKIMEPLKLKHDRIFKVHNLRHASRLKEFLQSNKVSSVVVIGAGYIGLEMLEAYVEYGIKNITVIGPRLVFTSKSQDFIIKEIEKQGINLIKEQRVKSLVSVSDTQLKVILDNGKEIETEMVQLSIGVVPATTMFKNTNLDMLPNGAVIVDEFCRTNIDGVYSAGDCATSYHNLLKKNVYIPLAPTANKQGRIAGISIAGIKGDPFPGIIGTAIWKVFDLYCSMTGISDKQAEELGYEVESVLITNNEIAHYYPGAKKMSILLRFDKKSHLLLGAEITAPSPLGAKKIDVLSTAISMKMKIEDIQKLDLAYAPPFSPVWDPILIAANIARKKLK
jgi:CoA-dependent NAD(P)H sulfur oxidoreductase